ncbi:MAG: 4Fe-4S binding protein [Candidatus Krumholzibacteriota bacterium]|nr:4Fe-4S binding protein [Candidatus Krumholzibacteriota bacterium]
MSFPEKYASWKGVPREGIDWHPHIDESKCVGCGMCVTSCGREVFDYDYEKKKAIVSNPLQCMVGCTSCKTWCVFNAISFPDAEYVKNLIKEKKFFHSRKSNWNKNRQRNKYPTSPNKGIWGSRPCGSSTQIRPKGRTSHIPQTLGASVTDRSDR